MPDANGGTVGMSIVPDLSSFGSLLSSGLRPALGQAEQTGKKIGQLIGGNATTGIVAGVGAAGIAIADFVHGSISEFTSLADSTRSVQRLTKANAEDASLYAGVLRHLGVDVGGANRGLGIFGANIASHPALFRAAGVAIDRNRDGTANLLGTLDNLRKTFVSTADATTRDAVAKQLLGRSYQTLLPYLTLTDDRLALFQRLTKEGGEVLHQKDVDQARQLKIEIQELTDHVEHLKVTVGRAGVGFLDNLLSASPAKLIGAIGVSLAGLSPGPLVALGLAHNKAGSAARQQAADEIDAKDAIAQMDAEAQAGASALQSLASAGEGVISAQEGVASAERGVAQARQGVTRAVEAQGKAHESTLRAEQGEADARQNLNELLAKGAVDAKAVESAERGVESSDRSVRDATEALSAAQERLNEVQAGATATELTDAHLSLASATLSLAEARRSLATVRPTVQDPFAAQRARLAVAQAVESQRKAQESLAQTQAKGTTADKNLTEAQRQVRDASERLTDAFRSQDDAEKKLREAQAGDPEFAKKVAAAKREVASAADAVHDAQQGEADAASAVRDAQDQVNIAEGNVEKANRSLRDAQYALNDAWDKAVDSGANLSGVLSELIAKYPELQGLVAQFWADANSSVAHFLTTADAIRALFGTSVGVAAGGPLPPQPTQVGAPGSLAGLLLPGGGRASGGDVYPGYYYRWKEQGEEYFAPKVAGTVIPAGGDGGAMPTGPLAPASGPSAAEIGDAVVAAMVAAGRPLVTVGEHVVLAQKRYAKSTAGRR